MGAFWCGQDKEIPHMNILQKAINQSLNKETYSSLLTPVHKQSIKKLFYGDIGSQSHQRYQQIMVKALPLIEKTHSNIESSSNSPKNKLVVTISQQSSLRSETNIENKSSIIIQTGFIIYQNGYYEGDIVNNKQIGLGVFYIISSEVIIIKGQWQSGKFIKGNLFQRKLKQQILTQQKLMYLELRDGVKKAVVETDNFHYEGSIKLDITTLNQMMTGEGTIYFKDTKANYTGKIKNGLFQTQKGEKSNFSMNKEHLKQIKFQGSYKNGLRQDEGTISFNYQDLSYKLILQYHNGKPKDQGKIKEYENWSITKNSQIISRPVAKKKVIN